MIKPTELRIGNYFHPSLLANGVRLPATGIVYQVGSVNKFGDVEVIEPTEPTKLFKAGEMAPIPLTEEWMAKFGMVTLDNEIDIIVWGFSGNSSDSVCYVSDGFDKPLPIHFEYDSGMNTVRREIRYVHELQNLHYALTGEELRLKSTLPK